MSQSEQGGDLAGIQTLNLWLTTRGLGHWPKPAAKKNGHACTPCASLQQHHPPHFINTCSIFPTQQENQSNMSHQTNPLNTMSNVFRMKTIQQMAPNRSKKDHLSGNLWVDVRKEQEPQSNAQRHDGHSAQTQTNNDITKIRI